MPPATLTREAKVQLAHDLRSTIRELKDRGLLVAAKWASELLCALPKEYRTAAYLPFSPPLQQAGLPPAGNFRRARPSAITELSFDVGEIEEAGPSRARTNFGIEVEEEDDALEEDTFQLAKAYFDARELERVVHTLRDARGPRARFLKVYAAYLSADKKAQDSLGHFLDTKEERHALFLPVNKLLAEIADDTEPYLIYLRGLLHMRLEQRDAAIDCFVRSVQLKPYNWSCWTQLAQLIDSADKFIELKEQLPSSPMLTFFAINVMLDLHTATDLVMTMITELQQIFPESVHLQAQRAMVFYHMRDFVQAETEFDQVKELDRFRMEEVDIFSNMLYVMNKTAKLGKIAHEYAEIDRNRPEVCALIGNYYSSRADHTKAIQYFKRALMFNRDYLPAWTLMGHEFVELKNTHAAIEAYRKAIDVNAKDYRAWYGLGQAYELLDMPDYAIEYYNQATSLRPYDCRMWTALATMYEHLGRANDAIAAHTRALLGADRNQTPSILQKLADLHLVVDMARGKKVSEQSIEFHRKLLALGERDGGTVHELQANYIAVAEYEMSVPAGDLALASQYLDKVAATNVTMRDRAADMLRELRVREARGQ